jgi:non-ribosomal peptide synthase protein (TIGR01720 family)
MLNRHAESPEIKNEATFWNDYVSRKRKGLPMIGLNEKVEKNISCLFLNKETTDKLLYKSNQAYNTGMNDLLLTALARTFFLWNEEDVIAVDLESHGRSENFEGIDVSRTVGWFTSVYPAVLDLKGITDIENQIITVKEQLRRIPGNGLDYGVLKYLSGTDMGLSDDREVLFNYLGQFDADMETKLFGIASEPTGSAASPVVRSNYKLQFNGMIAGGVFSMTLDSHVYGKDTLDEILACYKNEISRVIEFTSDKMSLFNEFKTNSNISNKKTQRIRI